MPMFPKKDRPQGQAANPPPQSDPFNKTADAQFSQGGNYPQPGLYPILYVDNLKMIKNRKNQDVFIATFDIIESEVDGMPRGTQMDWAANYYHDATPRNVKAFFVAMMDISPEELDADGMRYAISEDQPCRGRLVMMSATERKSEKTGNIFTACKWTAIPDEIQKKADELRQEAGFSPF